MKRQTAIVATAVALVALARAAGATGILIPEREELPPLAVRSHRVQATVEDGVATTRVTEVFQNNTGRRLEATFIFPLPKEAALTDFAMYVNGKRKSGEVMEAEQARQIYTDIVRRLRDPGLLEFMDSGLLRMKVFPVEPDKPTRVEVSYTHPLPFEGGVYEYAYPLRTGRTASKVLEDFTVGVEIISRQPIKNVYCPTHEVGITRKDDHHAVAGMEKMGATLDRDFRLFYAVGEKQFGLNLLTHRKEGDDGFFALMLSPRVELPQAEVMPKDVAFLIDVSGSMQQDDRIDSARRAVKFCLGALNPEDRFALITFSTTVEQYADGLQEADPENVGEAKAWVGELEARGGTDLCGAVLRGLEAAGDGERPYLVVLVTDGKPTIGVTATAEIIEKVEQANRRNVRVFPFGIAHNLDVPLLDRLAETTRGYSDYVAPGAEIERTISRFFGKVSHPVLTGLELDFGEVKTRDVYPPELPDLFRGSQLVAFGRYGRGGQTAVRLTGTYRGERKEFAYDANFPEVEPDNDFLPPLWARRKIAYLLDQIRLHGETEELKDEVVRLSKEYGIATPFTSYLVTEEQQTAGRPRADTELRLRSPGRPEGAPAPVGTAMASAYEAPTAVSEELRELKRAGALEAPAEESAVKRVAGKTFQRREGAWVDTAYGEDMEALEVKWGSDAYFALLDALPEVKDYLAIGESVVVVVEGKALRVGEEGREQMSVEAIRAFFGR
ncbi:MAG: VIT and vWA domain-containing protein [Planctomycetota bacterium]